MELSKSIMDNLRYIQNSSNVSDDIYNTLLIECSTMTITDKSKDKNSNRAVNNTKTLEIINATQADIVSLFIEAARHKYDRQNFMNFLHSAKISTNESRLAKLCDVYDKQRDNLNTHLSTIGNCLPCIVDVNWKLDYRIKTSTNDSIGDYIYHVRFVTKKYDKLDHIQFTCTIHQLQDLIYKLRDAVRHVEKLSHV